jgi:3-deoxy-manno-octulosonate cytidylyltransferase (CMP-KDO synthetase)
MGTLMRAMDESDNLGNPAIVKVVTDASGEALYFSRAPIPLVRDDPRQRVTGGLHYIHLGVYIYSRDTLLRFTTLPSGRLEEAEKLEQLRALEHGIRIRVWETKHRSLRVDTPEDVTAVAEALRRQEAMKEDPVAARTVPGR